MKERIAFGFLLGITCFLVGVIALAVTQKVVNRFDTAPSGMVQVEILKHCRSGDDKWTLLETHDGQRCYIECYRGEVGDCFYMWPDQIKGYRNPDSLEMRTLPPPIDLGEKDE